MKNPSYLHRIKGGKKFLYHCSVIEIELVELHREFEVDFRTNLLKIPALP